MGFWAWFTGAQTADKALDVGNNLINKVAGGLDQLYFGDEEKAELGLEAMRLHFAFIKSTQEESSIRSVTRRIVAWGIMGTFLMLILFCAGIWKFSPEWAKWVFELAKQMYELVLLVGFFYFGYFSVSSIVKKLKE